MLTVEWLDWPAHFLFFTGKGGVGKTTIASTAALALAEHGLRTLVVSTDPASNLDDVFEMRALAQPTPVPGVPGLSLMNIDPLATAQAHRERVVAPYRGVLPAAVVRSMEEQLSGACTVEIAAFDEFTGLLADPEAYGAFDRIIFDTAPTGHTLRLMSLPTAWNGFLATSAQGVSCLGPLAGLERQQAQYASAMAALADAAQTVVVLVSRPDAIALREAAHTSVELRALGIGRQRLVVNGVLGDARGDVVATAMRARQQAALAALPDGLLDLPLAEVPLVAADLTGIAALRRFAAGGAASPQTSAEVVADYATQPGLNALIAELDAGGPGVIMTMGKGGVGKTTLAVTIAVALANAGHDVHLSTTDPAAHIDDVLGDARTERLTTSVIDPEVETARYTAEIVDAAGTLDDEERALLKEDLRSPCTQEIAVFRAFARIVDRAQRGFVVLDTAPTGHTLLLLDATESYHREVARTTGDVPPAVRALLPRLRDPRFTRILIVTLAESTPVLEAERLQADLRRAGIEPFGWILNASLGASGTRHPVLAARARLENPLLRRVTESLAARAWLVPWRTPDQADMSAGAGAATSAHGLDESRMIDILRP